MVRRSRRRGDRRRATGDGQPAEGLPAPVACSPSPVDRKPPVSAASYSCPMTYEAFGEIPVRTGTFRAVVRAGATVTSHERTGHGDPVLLLVGPEEDIATPFWQAIKRAIGAQFRLVVPDPSPATGDLSGWLGNFLDGLGVEAASFVADERVGVAVIGFALLAPDRVSRLVLVSNGCPDVPDLDGSLGDRESTHPILVVRAQGDPEAVAASVVKFLAGS